MTNRSLLFLFITLFVSCTQINDKQFYKERKKEKHSIAILPFKGVDSSLVHSLKKGLQKKLLVEITVLGEATIPSNTFFKPRQRYIADSLLVFLSQTNNNHFEKILGVTTKDISTRKDPYENWGILGLGSCHVRLASFQHSVPAKTKFITGIL